MYSVCVLLSIGSSKGEVSREECIEKIAESINYVHSQTTSVITGVSCMLVDTFVVRHCDAVFIIGHLV